MQQASKPVLGLGQHVELLLDGAWYPSRVEEVDALSVAWPTDGERRLITVDIGAEIDLVVKSADALYTATAVVDGTTFHPVPLIAVRLDDGWQRAQRRNDVRLSVAIKPRRIARVFGTARKPVRAGLTNLSAGGVCVRSQDELRHGDLLELAFSLDALEVDLLARVERVQRVQRAAQSVWDAGCAFEDLPRRTGEQIVQFIFAQQRALARARRIS